ncbi:hypothetical protein K1719_030817 [Acacia pycnantha]|nr:hypothetical protein K1719_030817 [Acacia pycnantha]
MQKKATVGMSGLLTMKDFEGVKQGQHNLSSFEILLQVASVATKKYDLAHDYLIKEGRQKVQKSVMINTLKRKLEETESNEEWIEAMEMKRKKMKNRKKGSQNPPTPLPSLSKEFETKIIVESNEEWIEAMEMKRKKMKNRRKGSQNPPTPLPSLSKEFETKIIGEYGGTRIIRVIQKYLTETDVSKGHSRVTIPCSQVESFNFLDGGEMTNLRLGRSISVPLIHTPIENGMSLPLSETSLEFGQWDLHKDKKDLQKVSYQYVLKTNWNTIVETDDLRKKDHVQIWAFRDVHNQLCMALVKL